MPRATYGDDVKDRVKRLFTVLISLNDLNEDNCGVRFSWDDKVHPRKLVVNTTLRHLETLTKKDGSGTLTKTQIREALQRMQDFMGILEDNRLQKRGTENWDFVLKPWFTEKAKNLEQFEIEWDNRRPEKSKKLAAATLKVKSTDNPKTWTGREEVKRGSRGTNKSDKLSINNLSKAFGVKREQFIGRDQILDRLHALLQQNDLVAIVGMAGAGKTELAIQYARSQLHTYQGGVCWLLASDWRAKVVEFARSRFPDFNLPDKLSQAEQVAYCWQHWPKGEVLLLLDDVTDYKEQVKHDLPEDSRFKILITTREALGAPGEPLEPLELDVLEPDDALMLLKSLVKERAERFEEEPVFAVRLCEWLEYLPLGLELVGRYLHSEPNSKLSKILLELQQKALRHDSMDRDEVDLSRAMTAERGVEAAFELSWERLDYKSKHLGMLLSKFALAPILWEYVELTEKYYCNLLKQEEGFSLEILKKARRKLIYFHLLKYLDQQTYLLHSLIRKFFQSKREELNNAIN